MLVRLSTTDQRGRETKIIPLTQMSTSAQILKLMKTSRDKKGNKWNQQLEHEFTPVKLILRDSMTKTFKLEC